MDIDITKCTELVPGIMQKNENTYFIRCKAAGTWHYCNKVRLLKLIEKHGSAEMVGANYISRASKEESKPATPDIAKEVEVLEEEPIRRINPNQVELPEPPKKEYLKIAEIRFSQEGSNNWTRCMRPDIYRNNHGHCNGCSWFNNCKYPGAIWAKYNTDRNPNGLKDLRSGMIIYREGEGFGR